MEVVKAIEDQFANKAEFHAHLNDFKEKHLEIWRTLRGENQRIEGDITKIREGVSALKTSNEMQNQTLAAVQSDIKQLLSRRA